MKSVGKIKDGRLLFPAPINEARRQFIARLKDDTTVEETLIVPRSSKTQKQLGAIWGLALANVVQELDYRGYDTSFIFNTPNPTGIGISSDMLCEYMYQVCPTYNEDGKRITLSKMDTAQAAKFFDDCRNFWSSWSIYVPEPDPQWKEKTNGQD